MRGHYNHSIKSIATRVNAPLVVYYVVTTFIDDQTYKRGDETYRRVLMRNSFRVDGRVRRE